MSRLIRSLVLALLAAVPLAHADPGADAGMEAMNAIAFLEGRWEGSGWMQRGPEERHTFTSTESVERRLDGRLLIVEGLHHGPNDEVVHHAMAVISYDDGEGTYRFRSYMAGGEANDCEGALSDGAFVWGMRTERGRVRFTITVEDDAWHEVGHFSPDDGGSWLPFFEMTLERVAS